VVYGFMGLNIEAVIKEDFIFLMRLVGTQAGGWRGILMGGLFSEDVFFLELE
jgi:hypothetical protein